MGLNSVQKATDLKQNQEWGKVWKLCERDLPLPTNS